MNNILSPQDLLDFILTRAQAFGAPHGVTDVDAVLVQNTGNTLVVRLGALDKSSEHATDYLEFRVFAGTKSARFSTTLLHPDQLIPHIQETIQRLAYFPEDPYGALTEAQYFPQDFPDLDTFDPFMPRLEDLRETALRAEETMRALPGITNSSGAEAGWRKSHITLANTRGFMGKRAISHSFLYAGAVAGRGASMQRDSADTTRVFWSDLETPEVIGCRAAERAIAKLGPQQVKTGHLPVLLDRRVSPSLLQHLSHALQGPAIARGASFLRDHLGKPVFSSGVTLIDDPLRPRSLHSRVFDGEAVACTPRAIVDGGILTSWLLDVRSARELGLPPTGHANRGGVPGFNTCHMKPGLDTPETLRREMHQGLYVTEFLGSAINMTTGAYSRGVSGFWVEKGEITHPVSEITIAGNLREMFQTLSPANDLRFEHGMDAPSIFLPRMMIAGK